MGTVVIVGAGQAGLQAAQSLREEGFDGRLVLVGEEPHAPYQRPPLSKKYLAGEIGREYLELKPAAFFSTNEITCLFDCRVLALDPRERRVSLSDGSALAFDKALLATGSRPRDLPIPGGDLDRVFVLRSMADSAALQPRMRAGRRLVVIGGGYIGLEVAAVARGLGLEVAVLEAFDRVMARSTCALVSHHYEAMHRARGVQLALGTRVERLEETADGIAVRTDKDTFEADFVLAGIGGMANIELAEAAGLAVEGGIAVDESCRTSAPDIFAAGDCTFFPSGKYGRRVRLESVQNAIDQAKAAAKAMLGKPVCYDPVPWFWSDQYETKLQIAGLSGEADEIVLRGEPASGAFAIAYLRAGRLIAVDAVNRPRDYMMARRLVPTGHAVDRGVLADADRPLQEAVTPAAPLDAALP